MRLSKPRLRQRIARARLTPQLMRQEIYSRIRTLRRMVFAALCVAIGWVGAGPASAASLSVSFGSEYLQVGEATAMSLTFEGVSPDVAPPPPKIENAQVYPQNSRSMRWAQGATGATTIQVTFTYLVMPLKTGELTVPPITATVGGQTLTSKVVSIKVLTPDQVQDAQDEAMSKLAWIKIQLSKNEVYLGEVIEAQIQIFANGPEQLQLHQFKAEGFTLGRAASTTQGRYVENNRAYTVITFHMPIAARKIGRLPVGPAECTLNVQVPPEARKQNDSFGQLDVFGRYQTKPMRITSEIEQVNVLPLPTNNVPGHFNGAVGSFSMNVTAGPTNLVAGDPITYRVEIQAHGTLDDLNLPEQTGWREFKTYPPTSEITQKDPLGLSGTKMFEQIVVPEHAGIRELPPFYFTYFDPDQKRYKTLIQPAIALNITPNTAPASQPQYAPGMAMPKEEPEKPREDIAHIEPKLGALGMGGESIVLRPWYYLLQGLPFAAWLSALMWRRRQKALARDPRLLRRRQVDHLIQTGLKELRLTAGRGETESFYETTLRLLKERLGERLDLPSLSITEEVVDDRLRLRGVPEATLSRLHELFQTCNQARYAGQQSPADMNQTLMELEALLAILKDVRPA